MAVRVEDAAVSTPVLGQPPAVRGVQGWLDALVAWAIPRCGRWYVHVILGGTIVLATLVTAPLVNISLVPLWTGDYGKWWYVVVFCVATLVTAPVGLPLVFLPRHWALVRHLRGDHVDPAAVWRACVTRVPFSIWLTGVIWAGAVSVLGAAWVGPREDFSTATYGLTFAAHILICSAVGTFYFTLYEVALLPIARQVAAQLPPDFAEQNAITGRRRLMLLSTTITLAMGCAAAGLSYGFHEERDRIWAVVLATVLLMATCGGLLLVLVSSSVTRRVDELASALNQVGRGERPVRLLPTSGDEFDAVGAAYNTMVELLEAHVEELRASRARLVAVSDRTRQSIERDLHDGAQQSLALLSLQLGQLERGCLLDPEVGARVRRLRGDLGGVVAEMRTLAHGIYPAALEAEGLGSALRAAARESRVDVRLDLRTSRRWPGEVETALYFCFWEVLQHAQDAAPDSVLEVCVREQTGTATVEISGEGSLSPEEADRLLVFLQDRLGAVGGTVTGTSGSGLRYVGTVPVP